MSRHAPRPDPLYAICTIEDPWGIVYRVSFSLTCAAPQKLRSRGGWSLAR